MRRLTLNEPQVLNVLANARVAVSVQGRATGKTFDGAWTTQKVVHGMPRGTSAIVQRSYKLLMEMTLPPLIAGWENLGYMEDKHYWVGKRPPAHLNIPKPIQGPKSYDHAISWYTGHVFYMVSQDRANNFRGPSVQHLFLDEAVYLHKERLEDEVYPALRGLKHIYGQYPLYRSIKFTSSKPIGKQGRWLLDLGRYYERDGHRYDKVAKEITEVELNILQAGTAAERVKWFKERQKLKAQIRYYVSDKGVFYTEANIFDNVQNVGFQYIMDQYNLLYERARIKFLVEVLNVSLDEVTGSFYPGLNDTQHVYYDAIDYSRIDLHSADGRRNVALLRSKDQIDIDKEMPLKAGIDWGKTNVMIVGQRYADELRFVKEHFALHPEYTDHLVDKFVEYFEGHRNKTITVHYDHTGDNVRAGSADTLFQQFRARLASAGWVVRRGYHRVIDPEAKYHFWHRVLNENHDRDRGLPHIQINGDTCPKLIKSMQLSPIKQGETTIKKDKSSERKDEFPQDEATHASDAADILLIGEFDPRPTTRVIAPRV